MTSRMEGGPDSVRKLEIWQDAIERVETVYALTKTWPKEEIYGLPRGIMWNRCYSMV